LRRIWFNITLIQQLHVLALADLLGASHGIFTRFCAAPPEPDDKHQQCQRYFNTHRNNLYLKRY